MRDSSQWQQTRKRILTRDRRVCYLCGGEATQVDHITPEAQGGTHHEHNLAAICAPCHRRKSAYEGVAGRQRPPG